MPAVILISRFQRQLKLVWLCTQQKTAARLIDLVVSILLCFGCSGSVAPAVSESDDELGFRLVKEERAGAFVCASVRRAAHALGAASSGQRGWEGGAEEEAGVE